MIFLILNLILAFLSNQISCSKVLIGPSSKQVASSAGNDSTLQLQLVFTTMSVQPFKITKDQVQFDLDGSFFIFLTVIFTYHQKCIWYIQCFAYGST